MPRRILKRIVSLLGPHRQQYEVRYSNYVRREAEQKIRDMRADLNGCTDEWFLTPKTPLDECVPKDEKL